VCSSVGVLVIFKTGPDSANYKIKFLLSKIRDYKGDFLMIIIYCIYFNITLFTPIIIEVNTVMVLCLDIVIIFITSY